jgi:hypothetical protein
MNAFAEDVGNEGDIAELRQALRMFLLIVAGAGPGGHDHDARPLALLGVVIGEIALEIGAADLVVDGLHLDGSLGW